MQIAPVENTLISAVNPVLRAITKTFDVECERDGSLLVNSLKHFLGEDVQFCKSCTSLSRKIADPFYEIGSRVLRIDKSFMRSMFLEQEYGEAWLKGFALMMKGIRKYGVQIPFTPAGPFQVVWNFTYLCNLRCKHCYENAGVRLPELTTDQAYETLDVCMHAKPCVFFPTNEETVFGNILEDDFEGLWDNNEMLWELRSREYLESYKIGVRRLAVEAVKINIYVVGVEPDHMVSSTEN